MSDASTAQKLMDKAWRMRRESFSMPLVDRLSRMQAVNQMLKEAVRSATESGDLLDQAQGTRLLANVEYEVGHLDAADELWRRAIAISRELGDPMMIAHTVRHLGDLHRARNRLDEMHECYAEALELYREHEAGTEKHKLDYANLLIRYAEVTDEREAALEFWQTALELYRTIGLTVGVEHCEEQIAEMTGRLS